MKSLDELKEELSKTKKEFLNLKEEKTNFYKDEVYRRTSHLLKEIEKIKEEVSKEANKFNQQITELEKKSYKIQNEIDICAVKEAQETTSPYPVGTILLGVDYHYSYSNYKIINNRYKINGQKAMVQIYDGSQDVNTPKHQTLKYGERIAILLKKDGKMGKRYFKIDDNSYYLKDNWVISEEELKLKNEELNKKTKYSKEQFIGFTHRFIVKFKVDNDWRNDINTTIYSNSDSYQNLENFINKNKSNNVIDFKIEHRASKEEDEMLSKFLNEF